ncbi:hypothetical protein SARC_09131 [Sphaeroforma arctica JP610]|uniref:Uncharacterized protein n=1 Tax=Sphaeroforma arctica JP610 TaxID=667725 RepID=A0A0L0FR10_9EUKA|nr:hypothetical protein SARC_09131 [Sphaeroforma arctica JP610]KNC78443.1 hypothetical protein SARC_09131 [Sphaeroforma arctica JP610]|eukprot:XP_014152345.1 hypothetical protein SARC_09131 [Sphaeroforma arctica JP610]
MATAFKRRHAGPNPKPKKCSGGKMVLMQTGLETEAQLLFEKVTRKLNGHVANKFNSAGECASRSFDQLHAPAHLLNSQVDYVGHAC